MERSYIRGFTPILPAWRQGEDRQLAGGHMRVGRSGRPRRGRGARQQLGKPGAVEGRLESGRLVARGLPEGDGLRAFLAGGEQAALEVEGDQRLQGLGTGVTAPGLPGRDGAHAQPEERGEL